MSAANDPDARVMPGRIRLQRYVRSNSATCGAVVLL